MTEIRFPGTKVSVGGVGITNNGEFNIPTGSTYKFKINSTDKATIDSTTLKTDKIGELTNSSGIILDNIVKVDTISEKTSSGGITFNNDVKVDKILEKTASAGVEIANYVKLSANPRCLVALGGSPQNLSGASSATKLAFSLKIYDIGNGFNTSTNTYTFPVSGYYRITWNLFFSGINANQTQYDLSIEYDGGTRILELSSIGNMKSLSNFYIARGSYILSATYNKTLYFTVTSNGTLTSWSLSALSDESRVAIELITI
jgi:hypothetical protein